MCFQLLHILVERNKCYHTYIFFFQQNNSNIRIIIFFIISWIFFPIFFFFFLVLINFHPTEIFFQISIWYFCKTNYLCFCSFWYFNPCVSVWGGGKGRGWREVNWRLVEKMQQLSKLQFIVFYKHKITLKNMLPCLQQSKWHLHLHESVHMQIITFLTEDYRMLMMLLSIMNILSEHSIRKDCVPSFILSFRVS